MPQDKNPIPLLDALDDVVMFPRLVSDWTMLNSFKNLLHKTICNNVPLLNKIYYGGI